MLHFNLFISLLVALAVPAAANSPLSKATFQSHAISLTLDVPAQRALIGDQGAFMVDTGWNLFYLAKGATVDSLLIGGRRVDILTASGTGTAGLPEAIRSSVPPNTDNPEATSILFRAPRAGAESFYLSFSAMFNDSVEGVQFSREAIGREVTGTISAQGAYLSPSALFYPQGAETMATYRLAADIPSSWESVADGNSMSSEKRGDRTIQKWENPFASDGCYFMAAPYTKFAATANGTEVRCLFFPEDSALSGKYLDATTGYIKMYGDLIGPYPFKQFTVAENFFPTGYGMPGWTLLGQTVLKLPFIISTSLGHEVLHNWWGNSVYVDYQHGNWCEGLTTYGADYRYKLNESSAAAREYRKDMLKQYASYVKGDQDFALSHFASRTSADTRAVGYGKAMMVFHMIEEEIGSEPFFNAWKAVYRDYKGKQVSWSEWVAAFEKASNKDLAYVVPQWIERPGAPMLKLDSVTLGRGTDDGKLLRISISQDESQIYNLRVPVRAEGPFGEVDTAFQLVDQAGTFGWLVPARATAVTIDPDYHLFRRLYPEEIEPIISGVLGAKDKSFVVNTDDSTTRAAFLSFAGNFVEDSAHLLTQADLTSPKPDNAPVIFNPSGLPEYLAGRVSLTSDSVSVDGRMFPRAGHTYVLAAQGWQGFDKCMVVLTDDLASLPRLGQLVPHYGKYSYLVFEGAKNVAKGQWPVGNSPLRASLTR